MIAGNSAVWGTFYNVNVPLNGKEKEKEKKGEVLI